MLRAAPNSLSNWSRWIRIFSWIAVVATSVAYLASWFCLFEWMTLLSNWLRFSSGARFAFPSYDRLLAMAQRQQTQPKLQRHRKYADFASYWGKRPISRPVPAAAVAWTAAVVDAEAVVDAASCRFSRDAAAFAVALASRNRAAAGLAAAATVVAASPTPCAGAFVASQTPFEQSAVDAAVARPFFFAARSFAAALAVSSPAAASIPPSRFFAGVDCFARLACQTCQTCQTEVHLL